MSGSIVHAGSGVGPSGDPSPSAPLPLGLVQFLSGAYNLTSGDNNKYLVCSGGSWVLGLPAAMAGLAYRVRNDMGISGTTGTITLTPTSGTIDGLASLALLPGQECTILTDGTNWRSFGRQRVVVIGTQDITAAQANGVILLPLGYRIFELEFAGIAVSAADYMVAQFSMDGGSTWKTSLYYHGVIFNNAATTVAFSDNENVANFYVHPPMAVGPPAYGGSRVTIYPGSGSPSIYPSFIYDAHARSAGSLQQRYAGGGLYVGPGPVNALKYFYASANNITQCFITVRGIV